MTSATSVPALPTAFVIDDDAAIREALEGLLRFLKFDVRTFASATQFLEACAPDWTGVLLVDQRMPEMDGLELLAELRRRESHLRAILMTGHGDEAVQRAALEAGAVGILEKPFRMEPLMELMGITQCP